MRSILNGCKRTGSLASHTLVLYLSILAFYALCVGWWNLLSASTWLLRTDWVFHTVLLAVLGGCVALWMTAHVRGHVGIGTCAGFTVAALGLFARFKCDWMLYGFGMEGGLSVYDPHHLAATTMLASQVWFHRNIGLAAYAFGLVFVALSSWTDWRLRRVAPAWVTSHE